MTLSAQPTGLNYRNVPVEITIGHKEVTREENELTGERPPVLKAVTDTRSNFEEWDTLSGSWVNFGGNDLASK